MANDQIPEQETLPLSSPEDFRHTATFVVVFLLLGALAWCEIRTLRQFGSLRDTFETQQSKMQNELTAQLRDQLADRFAVLERSNNRHLDALKEELDSTAKRMGSAGQELGRARGIVKRLQTEQARQAAILKQELASKADQQQLLALSDDVSTTKTNLDSTKKTLDALAKDLGMARSELGTLIARNHNDIEQLRKLGDRDYYEFTLDRSHPQHVAAVGLALKRTNVKRHRFTLAILADDLEIEKKDRTINEPIFFYIAGTKKPYELVVNRVQSDQVVGYLSTPKGATQVGERAEGAR